MMASDQLSDTSSPRAVSLKVAIPPLSLALATLCAAAMGQSGHPLTTGFLPILVIHHCSQLKPRALPVALVFTSGLCLDAYGAAGGVGYWALTLLCAQQASLLGAHVSSSKWWRAAILRLTSLAITLTAVGLLQAVMAWTFDVPAPFREWVSATIISLLFYVPILFVMGAITPQRSAPKPALTSRRSLFATNVFAKRRATSPATRTREGS